MAPTVLTFDGADAQPPVFIAGAFTDWAPVEMSQTPVDPDGAPKPRFSYTADLAPGTYQYKFRLGHGDWWVVNESAATTTDEAGNVNNVVAVNAPDAEIPTRQPPATVSSNLRSVVSSSHVETKGPAIVPSPTKALDASKEDFIPDIAPPPYSMEATTPPTVAGGLEKKPAEPETGKGRVAPGDGDSGQFWLAQNVVWVAALIIVPVAVSYYLFR